MKHRWRPAAMLLSNSPESPAFRRGESQGTMIDIVPKFMVAVPDWPCIVKCAAAELVLTLLPLPPLVVPAQEVSPAPSTTMSAKAASPRITAEDRLPFRR